MCPYDTCALRIEPELFGAPRIVRGVDALPAGRIGVLFGDDLSRAVVDNEVAYGFARRSETARLPAAALAVAGTLATFYGLLYLQVDRSFENEYGELSDDRAAGALAAVVIGGGLTIAGGALQVRANRAQSRAVWEYNRGLSR